MANKAYDIYQDYKKRVENRQPTNIIKTYADIQEFINHSTLLGYQCKTYGSGRFVGLYELNSTKEVFEVWASEFSGWYERMIVWQNKESWDNHREATPFNIYMGW